VFRLKKSIYIGIGFLVAFSLSGCFNYDKEAEELIEYYNEWLMIRIEEPEKEAFTDLAWERNEGKQEQIINEAVLPVLQESIEYLENVELKHKKIQQLNALHIEAEQYALEMFQEVSDIMSEGRKAEVDNVLNFEENDELDIMIENFNENLEELMDKYNVYWIIEYDEYGNERELLGRDR